MQKEDWRRVAKMIGYVYLPIVLLVIGIFLLVQFQSSRIKKAGQPDVSAPPLIVPAK